jgi:FtsP/CotA-like multicopper oxidase with cupredoxin domain
LINASAEALQHLTIDSHTFLVVSLDFVPIYPFIASKITLSPGQRANIIVFATGNPTDSIYMRSDIDPICSASSNPHALAMIYYPKADMKKPSNSTATPYTALGCATDALSKTTPAYALSPPSTPATTLTLDITLGTNSTGHLLWYLNNSTFFADTSRALLTDAAFSRADLLNPNSNIYNLASNTSVRLVMRNYHISPHPMHLHGHDFWILAEGRGSWDYNIVNAKNPIRRDTHQLLPMEADDKPGYAVIEWTLDNPGIWAFHCHIFSHSSLGFYMNIVESPQRITGLRIPSEIEDTCTKWNKYAKQNIIDQPDAGI